MLSKVNKAMIDGKFASDMSVVGGVATITFSDGTSVQFNVSTSAGGGVGPVGPTGSTGQTGPVGPTGPSGSDGSSGSSGGNTGPLTVGAIGSYVTALIGGNHSVSGASTFALYIVSDGNNNSGGGSGGLGTYSDSANGGGWYAASALPGTWVVRSYNWAFAGGDGSNASSISLCQRIA